MNFDKIDIIVDLWIERSQAKCKKEIEDRYKIITWFNLFKKGIFIMDNNYTQTGKLQ
jgi:hypothetical protein